MGSTNKTAHYNLPQFIGTDKPGWLTDVNDAMQKTDEGIYQAAVAAQGAQTSADAATSAVQTVNADLNDTKTTLTATTATAQSALTNTQQQAGQIAQNSTNISTINARMGNTDISGIGGGTVTGAIKSISEQAGAQIDDTVTATSEHAVKSSGINTYVQGITRGLTFGQDTEGNWGYKIGGADPVIPFKSGGTLTYIDGTAYSGPAGGYVSRSMAEWFVGLPATVDAAIMFVNVINPSQGTYQAPRFAAGSEGAIEYIGYNTQRGGIYRLTGFTVDSVLECGTLSIVDPSPDLVYNA